MLENDSSISESSSYSNQSMQPINVKNKVNNLLMNDSENKCKTNSSNSLKKLLFYVGGLIIIYALLIINMFCTKSSMDQTKYVYIEPISICKHYINDLAKCRLVNITIENIYSSDVKLKILSSIKQKQPERNESYSNVTDVNLFINKTEPIPPAGENTTSFNDSTLKEMKESIIRNVRNNFCLDVNKNLESCIDNAYSFNYFCQPYLAEFNLCLKGKDKKKSICNFNKVEECMNHFQFLNKSLIYSLM